MLSFLEGFSRRSRTCTDFNFEYFGLDRKYALSAANKARPIINKAIRNIDNASFSKSIMKA